MKGRPWTDSVDRFLSARLNEGVILCIMLSFLFLFPAAESSALTAGTIDIKGLHSIGRDEFLDMFGVKEGDTIDPQKIRNGIRRSFLKGIFEDISVSVSEDEHALVGIMVKERNFIREIHVTGDSAVRKKEIRKLLLLREGQVFRHEAIQSATADLIEKIRRQGYPHAECGIEVSGPDARNRVDISVAVNTGEPLLIKKRTFSFVLPLPPALDDIEREMAGRMKLSEGDVYNQVKLADDLLRLNDYLRKIGYINPAVGPYTYENGALEIMVRTGRHLDFTFEGNRVISDKILRKEVPFFEVEDFSDDLMGETTDRILDLYHQKGYSSAQIAPVITSDEVQSDITFFIFEGEKTKIRAVQLEGVNLPHERIKEAMSLKEGGVFNPDLIERDKEFLSEFYGALGYLDMTVSEIEQKFDPAAGEIELTIFVEEGGRTEIASVDVTGVEPELRDVILGVAALKPGDPYNEVDIADARFRILEYYYDHGFPNNDVRVSRSEEDSRVGVTFEVSEGDKKVFGKTVVTGNQKTRYEVIRRELLQKEGKPYNLRTLSKDRQRLYKLGLFTNVEMEAIDGAGDEKDVVIKVEEGKAGFVEFGFGYAEYEKFRGFAEIGYNNLWGMNRQGLLRTELSTLETRYIIQYKEPWFMGRALPFKAFFLYEDRREINLDDRSTRYKLQRYTLTAGVEKKISDRVRADLFYEFSLVDTSDVQPDVVLSKEDSGSLAISSIKPALIYDTRDNPFDPQKGFLAGVSMKAASFVLFSETDFVKLEVFGSTFHKLNRRMTLALSLRGGVAYNFGDTEELPLVERFFLGGRSSVRGYEQDTLGPKGIDRNPTGGNAFLMGNVELRTNIGRGFALVPFVDMGNVWIKTADVDPGEIKYTAGLGLRYYTPVGPLRVDYGHKFRKETGESSGEVHFSIGHAF